MLKKYIAHHRLHDFLEAEGNLYEAAKRMEQDVIFGAFSERRHEKMDPLFTTHRPGSYIYKLR